MTFTSNLITNELIPLHPAQEEVYFDQLMHPGSAHYNIGGYLKIKGKLHIDHFKQAIKSTINSVDIFGIRFDFSSEYLRQQFNSQLDRNTQLDYIDLTQEISPEKAADDWVQQCFSEEFDLSQCYLYKNVLLKLSEGNYRWFSKSHHLIIDGYGYALYVQLVVRAYNNLHNNMGLEWLEGFSLYQKKVLQTHKYLTSDKYNIDKNYWLSQNYFDLTPLISPQYSSKFKKSSHFSKRLTLELSRKIKQTSSLFNVGILQLVIAALSVYFCKTNSAKVVSFGLPIHNRRNRTDRSTLGMLMGVMPFIIDAPQSLLTSELITHIAKKLKKNYRHQQYPLAHLKRELNKQGGDHHLLDVQVNYEKFQLDVTLESLESEVVHLSTNDELIPLQIRWFDYGDSLPLKLKLSYRTDYFSVAEAELLADRLIHILLSLEQHHDQSIGTIPIVMPQEIPKLLIDWNQTAAPYPEDKCIHELFEAQADNNSNAIAVVFEAQQLTYGELNQRANQLAHYLIAQGVKPDTVVGLFVERSLEMIVGLLGILKAGGAYVPLAPSYPSERLAYMIEDSGVELLVTQTELKDLLPNYDGTCIYLDNHEDQQLLAQYSNENITAEVLQLHSRHLAYVIYTSGSTGKPKGVCVEHVTLVNFLSSMKYSFGVDSTTRLLGVTPLSFDIHTLEVFLPIINGAKLIIASSTDAKDASRLILLLQKHVINIMQATPATWQSLLLSDWKQETPLQVLCGGDVMTKYVKQGLLKQKGVKLWNMFGPTEATVWSSIFPIKSLMQPITIGKPISNTHYYVLDNRFELLPIGVAGELYIGGKGLARGYLNRPELTAEKFIQNPFSDDPNDRLYRTGDLVRWLPDGNLEFIGRMDHQVKIRGFRIELGEIEAALSRQACIQDVVVVARESQAGDKQLVAYVVPSAGKIRESELTERELVNELTHSLKQQLPDYMVPAALVILEALPLTPNGKVDRNALPAPDYSATVDAFIAPTTETEVQLASLWQALLSLDQPISVSANFFELGGHSLLAVRLVTQIRTEFSVEVTVKDLFDTPQLSAIAALIEQGTQASLPAPFTTPEIIPRTEQVIELPLSYAQQRLWFLDQLEGGSVHYNMPGTLLLEGKLNLSALNQALSSIIERHESLRTCFTTVDGQAYQHIMPLPNDWAIEVVDLRLLKGDALQQTMQQHQLAEATKPFDLSQDYLLRGQLLQLPDHQAWLLLTMHHIASDGWSIGILIHELNTLYAAYCQGQANPLPPLPIQYADYALWQRDYLQGEVLAQQVGYWQAQLQDLPDVHQLPLDHPRPAIQTFDGATYQYAINQRLSEAFNHYCVSQGATLFMGLHAAFSLLLSRYSGETDIVVGSPVANREQAEVSSLIGFFVNTLVMRADLSENPSFKGLLAQCKQTALDAYAHQQVPFEQLVEVLQPSRHLSHHPLFQVMLALENTQQQTLSLPELTLSVQAPEFTIAKFDLTLNVSEEAEGLILDWEYNTQLFEAATIQRLAIHFNQLLTEIIKSPNQPVNRLSLLTEKETQQQLIEWNQTAAPYPADKCIHELFEAQADNNPDVIAVVFEAQQLTYGELNQRANQLAHYLIEQGVKPDTLVGLCVERSLDMIVGLLGILKAGGAYVPLDPSYPTERLAYMVEDSAIRLIVTQQALIGLVPNLADMTTVCLDNKDDQQLLSQYSNKNIANDILQLNARHLAYVIYTSGSTGKPKGVLVNHTSIINLLNDFQQLAEISSQDHCALWTQSSFDVSIYELFSALCYRATLYIVPAAERLNADMLFAWLRDNKINSAYIPPFFIKPLVEWHGKQNQGLVLKRLLVGVEPILEVLLDEIKQLNSNLKIINGYGPSETTICSTLYSLPNHNNSTFYRVTPIGRPVKNTQIYVLSPDQKLLPIGVAGELYIGGTGLARGYLNRPELTAEKFIQNPFSDDPNARLYRTGDLVRWLPDGNLEFIGRMDHQVKIRGFRIELGEIETALSRQACIQDVVVVARESHAGDKQLVAYVVPSAGKLRESELTERELVNELTHSLKQQLPDYMVPAALVILETLPLTPNGKVDRNALPAPDYSATVDAFIAPITETEVHLASLWQALLSLEKPISVSANFFELGGHSLLAVRLVTQIRAEFSVEVTVKDLFNTPQLSAIAALIEQGTQTSLPAPFTTPEIIPRTEQVIELPLSYAQQRLWFLDQLEGGSVHYNMPGTLLLEGKLNLSALNQALSSIIERHESLRTCFTTVDGQAYQHIMPLPNDWAIEVVDLRGLKGDALQQTMQQHQLAEATKPFDLSQDCLLRGQLLQLTDHQAWLLLTMHHIASDGWSIGILIHELNTLYAAYCQGQANPLPPLPIQYADYALWQRDYLQGEVLAQQIGYWQAQLQGLPDVHQLPLDHPRPAVQTFDGATYQYAINQRLSEAFNHYCVSQGATLFMGLHAAFSLLLSRYSGETDIVVGSPVANREQAEVSSLIGFFVNTLVMRADLSENPSFKGLLAQCKQTALDAYAHQQVPFEQLVEVLQPSRHLSHHPLFQVMLALENTQQQTLSLPELTLSVQAPEFTIAKFDLTLNVSEEAEGLILDWEYNTQLFDATTIQRLAIHFNQLLTEIVAKPNQPVNTLSLLTDKETQQQLIEWNQTAAPYSADKCIHELFEAQADSNPDVIAVVFEAQQLTYGELNQRANQLAHYLIEQGVKPDTLVGLCVERSLDMIIGLLGILKAGGTYVPLDPSYPTERLAYMVEDSGIELIVTQQVLKDLLPSVVSTRICLDHHEDQQLLAQYAKENILTEALQLHSRHLAYVIYTSGSTGKPKGVLIEHRCLVSHMLAMHKHLKLAPDDNCCQFSNIGFDAATEQIFIPLLTGAALYLKSAILQETHEFIDWVNENKITYLDLPPNYAQEVFYALSDDKPFWQKSQLRYLVVGGDALNPLFAKVWCHSQATTQCQLINAYGPTETTITATLHRVTQDSLTSQQVPIGKPIDNVTAYVLNDTLQLLPIGVSGELYIGGTILARGYLNRPELTAEKFIQNPFSDDPNDRLYGTGDLVRWLPDGTLEFIGRIDHQVKIRGFRIELGEVETALSQQACIQDVVVVARESQAGGGDKQLVAYVVPAAGKLREGELTESELADELRHALKQQLPDYMVPAAFVVLEKLPLTLNGKVDRKALPAPDYTPQADYVAPASAIEKQLCEIWQSVLGVEQICIHANFFSVGGDSIKAMQVASRAQRAGLALTTRQLFTHQTIAELALQVTIHLPSVIPQAAVEGMQTLLPIQQQFLTTQTTGTHYFNQAVRIKLPANTTEAALHQSLSAIVARHDVLRLAFQQHDSTWQADYQQLVPQAINDTVHCLVVPATTDEARQQLVIDEVNQLQASFDLVQPPLSRWLWVCEEEKATNELIWIMHHLIVDGVSWRVLLQDFQQSIQQYTASAMISLPPKTSSYQAWAQQLKVYCQSQSCQKTVNYWQQVVSQPVMNLPAMPLLATDDLSYQQTGYHSLQLSETLTQQLLQQANGCYHTQINDLLLTALLLAVTDWAGIDTLRVDLEGHGRENLFEGINLSETVGWFTSIFPVYLRKSPHTTADVGEHIKNVKEQLRQIPNKGIDYGILQCFEPNLLSDNDQSAIVFNYLGQFDQAEETDSIQLLDTCTGESISPQLQREHLLGFNCLVVSGHWELTLDYHQGQFTTEQISQLADKYQSYLTEIIQHCTSSKGSYTPSDFSLVSLSQSQLDQLQQDYPTLEDLYPTTPMQQGMLFHSELNDDSGVYMTQLGVMLHQLDPALFQQCWQQLMSRHAILRTVFVSLAGQELLQLVQTLVDIPWQRLDWRHLSDQEQQAELQAVFKEVHHCDSQHTLLMNFALAQVDHSDYWFIWHHHHALLDGWCLPILFKELFTLYKSGMNHQSHRLPTIVPYRDYIAWLQQQNSEQAEDYWRAYLSGFSAPIVLPIANQVATIDVSQAQQEASLTLSTTLTVHLQQLAQNQQVTLNSIIQMAWGLLLSRYSGEQDVVFGSTRSGRPEALPGVEQMVGLFINSVPMRLQLTDHPSIADCLQQLQKDQASHDQYSYAPLVDIQGWSEVGRGCHLFESLIVFENYPLDASLVEQPKAPDQLVVGQVIAAEQTNYPLTLSVIPGEQLRLKLLFQPQCFTEDNISRLLGHLQQLLVSITQTETSSAITQLNILTEKEIQQLLIDWNQTAAPYPANQCIHELFEAQAEDNPDAIAVIFERQQLTYGELNQRTNQLARYLTAQGVKPDTLVGLCVERSLDMIVGLLGILKAGGAYVPLDPYVPLARLNAILDDCQPVLLLTQMHLTESLISYSEKVICLDTDWHVISNYSNNQLSTNSKPNDLAYVIYTSGSTGKPKGVLQQHKTIVNLVHHQKCSGQLVSAMKTLQFTNITFDVALQEIATSWLTGSCLVLMHNDARFNISQLVDLLFSQSIERLFIVPALLNVLVDFLIENDVQLTALKEIITAGEALQITGNLYEFIKNNSSCCLWNHYGPSETHVVAIEQVKTYTIGDYPPIGKPLKNHQCYVVNQQIQLQPIGVPGELLVMGTGLARGYLNRPELTAEKFIQNPFSDDPNDRLYRTGDLVRWLPDGNLEFIGRMDHQVKIRGFRIELGEVESALLQHKAVQETVAVTREDAAGGKQLVAYVVPSAGKLRESELTERELVNELTHSLKQQLPDYMVPAALVILETLPLTPNGKVDRNALPAPDYSATVDAFIAPTTETEVHLASLWQALLSLEKPISVSANFFELGGHSLLAVRLVTQIRAEFSVEVTVKDLFNTPQLSAIAALIEQGTQTSLPAPFTTPEIIPRTEQVIELPLSYAQQRLWFLDQLEGGSVHYNMPGTLLLEGKLNLSALNQALSSIIERHESLRTCFTTVDGQAYQHIMPLLNDWAIEVVDLRLLKGDALQQTMQQHQLAEATKPFDLSQDCLLRGQLLQLPDHQAWLLLTMHHIASDGWSIGILIHELNTLYAAYCQGQANPLPPLPIQYADYALWQRDYLQGEVLAQQVGYWQAQLQDLPDVHQLPLDHPRPAIQTFDGATYQYAINQRLSEAFNHYCVSQGATLFMGLHAAFSLLLSRYSGETDIVIGTPIANREQAEVDALIGFFVNTLVMRTNLSENPTFDTLLKQCKQTALDAYAHQQVPFEQLVEVLQPSRHLSHHPLFQVMLALENTQQQTLSLPELTLSVQAPEFTIAKFDLTLNVSEEAEGLILDWEYNTQLFEATTIQRLATHFHQLLTEIVAKPNQPVNTLSLLTDKETQQQLIEWNQTAAPYPADKCIHELFEAQAEKNPNAIAVVFEEQQLTYGELNQRANQLAHYLIEQGVKPDTLVGLCVERSLDMIVGLLGILKAGGTYVPLDPNYPTERLAYMVEDSAIRLIVTQQALIGLIPNLADMTTVCLDNKDDQQLLSQYSNKNIANDILQLNARHLAYVIYTSGSTGKPKGVCVEHTSVIRLVNNTHYIQLSPLDVIAQASNYSFDAATFEIWGSLLNGAKLVYISKTTLLQPTLLKVQLERDKINTLFITTALFNAVAEQQPDGFSQLKTLLFGGEHVSANHIDRVLTKSKPDRLLHVYGPTENTTFSTWYEINEKASLYPIGTPLTNSSAYVVDEKLCLCPIGVVGELVVGGIGLARGYLNRPELTAEKFIQSPFSDNPNDRLYRTGDLVRWLPDGNLEFIGRIDHQVKIRGFRIELGEIEAVLSQQAGVQTATVVAREDQPGDKRIVAYVVSAANSELTENQLIDELSHSLTRQLPDYMVPTVFVVLGTLPLTPNGKVDHKALPAPNYTTTMDEFVAPATDSEIKLASIWQTLLQVDQPISVNSNFFALGGHSLLVMKLVSAINDKLGIQIAVRDIFGQPRLKDLATFIDTHSIGNNLREWIPLVRLSAKPLTNNKCPKLYCVPGAGGFSLAYQALSNKLSQFAQVLVFEAKGLDGIQKPHDDWDVLINRYLEAIIAEQPSGPYYLLGHSFGGRVVFELARRLEAFNHEVHIIILDTVLSNSIIADEVQAINDMSIAEKVLQVAVQFLGGTPQHSNSELPTAKDQLKQLMVRKGLLPSNGNNQLLNGFLEVYAAQESLFSQYVPSGQIQGKLYFLYSEESFTTDKLIAAQQHYNQFCCNTVEVCKVAGGHVSMLKADNVQSIVTAIMPIFQSIKENNKGISFIKDY